MELTSNYQLRKYGPQGEGKPLTAYTTYNPTMDIIDELLFGHEQRIKALEDAVSELTATFNTFVEQSEASDARMWAALSDVIAKFYGGGSIDSTTGNVTWPTAGKAAVGTVNIASGIVATDGIFTHDGTRDNDVRYN